ncbi:EF-hand domain-containing protein [Roseomonas sp. CECT 9278]|uniref:EF-hand domain-containing protein n=1 Tax=Roseomonas sp. CECT 9278 TaxID=2845823 RepID=UPI001E3BAF49|nr:EF-hand domain-containing protein [Roseomonas sp. CECT 9278]CAH0170565.1 hypothetical protein ROS9278_01187 [Roseomonas sp. CECT 9278]
MRKTTTMMALAAALAAGTAGVSMAQPAPGGPPPGGPGVGRDGGPGHHHRGPRGGGFAMGEAFARADTNADGRVTREEGVIWLQARFTEMDANRDGGVTIEEVRAYYEAQRPAGRRGPPEAMRERMQERGAAMFRFIDVNGDGRVTFEELRPMAEAAFRAADRNADGALERNELRRSGPEGRGDRPMPGQPGQPGAPAQPAR